MRYRISSKLRWTRFMFIILGIFLLFLLGNSLSKQVIDYESVIVQLVFLSISIILYFLFDKAKTVEFDTNYMYVSGKGEEERILLSDVFKIKLTMTKKTTEVCGKYHITM